MHRFSLTFLFAFLFIPVTIKAQGQPINLVFEKVSVDTATSNINTYQKITLSWLYDNIITSVTINIPGILNWDPIDVVNMDAGNLQ